MTITLLLSATAMAKTSWDMPLPWPPENVHTQNAQIFADEVKKATNGEVEIKLHPGGALGYKGPEMLSVIRDGLAPIGQMLTSQLVGEEEFFGIEAIAYLAPSLDSLAMLQKFSRPEYDRLLRKHNQKLLYHAPWAGQQVFTKQEISTLADLKNVKIRTVDKNSSDFFDNLGATAVQMPWGEVIPALASGAIDGVSTSSASAVDGKFWEFIGFGCKFNWHSAGDIVTVNLDAWNKLSPELRDIIETRARELEPLFWKRVQESDLRSEAMLIEKGMKVTVPSPELKVDLLQKAQPVWENFIQTSPEAKRVVEDYKLIMGIE
jgi:TRAP-type C4-dicarboxylate transport system substrate-binding protein